MKQASAEVRAADGLDEYPFLRDLLALVERRLTRRAFRTWTPTQRLRATQYAWRAHLRASDNVVKVPTMPACVKRLPFFVERRVSK